MDPQETITRHYVMPFLSLAVWFYIINTSLIHSFHQDFPSSADHLLRSICRSGMKLRTTRRHRVESCFSRGSGYEDFREYYFHVPSLIRVPFRALPPFLFHRVCYFSLHPLGILIASSFKFCRFSFLSHHPFFTENPRETLDYIYGEMR